MPGPVTISGSRVSLLDSHPKWGRWVSYPDIAEPIHLHAQQRWMPHEASWLRPPFAPGDMVEVTFDYLTERYGISVAHVSRSRWWMYHKNSGAYPVVELYGLPLTWFSARSFKKINP